MGRREPYTSKSIDDFYRSIGLEPEEPEQLGKTVTEEAEIPMADEPSGVATEEAAMPQKRVSSKQRRLSLDEYRTTYLKVPKLSTASPCSSVRRCVTSWTGLSATSEGRA